MLDTLNKSEQVFGLPSTVLTKQGDEKVPDVLQATTCLRRSCAVQKWH